MPSSIFMKHRASDNPPKLLVVEDDKGVARMLCFSLRMAGFDVTDVATGGEALHILDQGTADAVVLDLILPDGLGGAVLDRLRDLDQQGSFAWVAISALNIEEAARRYGPLEPKFLAKPFDPWVLVSMIEDLMPTRRD